MLLTAYMATQLACAITFASGAFSSSSCLAVMRLSLQTKNPLAVQPHLRKCFEAIESLDFGDDLTISAMNSREKEKVEE
jgi:hypothetical protein